jgi:hypothetical protein
MVLTAFTSPDAWAAAQQFHAANPKAHASRVYARRWQAAGAAAALAPVRDSEVRTTGASGLVCSDVCAALLIQDVLTPGDAMRAGVLARMLADSVIDLGHVRLALTQNPQADRNCIVDCTVITPDGADFTTSLPLWTADNDDAEMRLSEDMPTAYLNQRTGEVFLWSELHPLHLSALELHQLLTTPVSQRSAFIAGVEAERAADPQI